MRADNRTKHVCIGRPLWSFCRNYFPVVGQMFFKIKNNISISILLRSLRLSIPWPAEKCWKWCVSLYKIVTLHTGDKKYAVVAGSFFTRGTLWRDMFVSAVLFPDIIIYFQSKLIFLVKYFAMQDKLVKNWLYLSKTKIHIKFTVRNNKWIFFEFDVWGSSCVRIETMCIRTCIGVHLL